jgi:hypothetical protein
MESILVGMPYVLYLLWPLIVILYLYWKNSLLIDKKTKFLLICLLANFLIFAVGFGVVTSLAWWMSSALLLLTDYSEYIQIVSILLVVTIYLIVLFTHVFFTKIIVKKFI